MRDLVYSGSNSFGPMSHLSKDRKRMRMTESWSDYLLCQLAADKNLSTLESLPAEILLPILEELHLNSICGVRALACASRTCRALASPYLFNPFKCEFSELVRIDLLDDPPVVTLTVAENFKTLRLHEESQPKRDRLMKMNRVLSIENTYECVEFLPNVKAHHLKLSAPALDLLRSTLPLLSRLTINLGDFIGYSANWDKVFRKTRKTRTVYSYERLVYSDKHIVRAIARFQNLRHLTIHFTLQPDQIALMHPKHGREAVRQLFDSIQRCKQGQVLVRLDVVFYTNAVNIFGHAEESWDFDRTTVSTTMTITCNHDTSPRGGQQPQYSCTCENPRFGKAIEHRRRAERLYGEWAWKYRLGEVQWNLTQGRYPALPRRIMMQSLMRMTLLPSYFVFEKGKMLRYDSSMADVGTRNRKDSKRRTRFKEIFFWNIISKLI